MTDLPIEVEADLVVLATATVPRADAQELGQREVSLWCSDLKRAHQTALAVAAALKVEEFFIIVRWLRDRGWKRKKPKAGRQYFPGKKVKNY